MRDWKNEKMEQTTPNMKKLLLLCFLGLAGLGGHAQNLTVERINEFYAKATLKAAPGQDLALDFGFPITGLALEAADLQGAYLETPQRTDLRPGAHTEPDQSNLVVFGAPRTGFGLHTGQMQGQVVLHLLYAPPLPPEKTWWEQRPPVANRTENNCQRPESVPQAEWRAGLRPPASPPSATQVRFIIVHHEAGSNTATNFTQTVRNIYLLHTQTNGWNDIGYNFVIAQNGTIFDGRDGQGRLDGDNVLGAHFCGKNGNTMGICLLGNYQTSVEPTSQALASLARLISWKMVKEGLDNPMARGIHAQGTPDQSTINVISGHRDGCATDCPGDNVYKRMQEIRQSVLAVCNVLADEEVVVRREVAVYPNPARQQLIVELGQWEATQLELTTPEGRVLATQPVPAGAPRVYAQVGHLAAGVYLLRVSGKQGTLVRRLVVE